MFCLFSLTEPLSAFYLFPYQTTFKSFHRIFNKRMFIVILEHNASFIDLL